MYLSLQRYYWLIVIKKYLYGPLLIQKNIYSISERYLGQSCSSINQCHASNTICSETCQCAPSYYDDTGTFDIGGSCVQSGYSFCIDRLIERGIAHILI